LFTGIVASDENSYDADSGGHPKSYRFSEFEPKLSALQSKGQPLYTTVKGICAICLIFGSLILLGYSLKRTDYLVAVGFLGGLLPFALGGFLLLSVFGLIH
jgi:hypothetical protein